MQTACEMPMALKKRKSADATEETNPVLTSKKNRFVLFPIQFPEVCLLLNLIC